MEAITHFLPGLETIRAKRSQLLLVERPFKDGRGEEGIQDRQDFVSSSQKSIGFSSLSSKYLQQHALVHPTLARWNVLELFLVASLPLAQLMLPVRAHDGRLELTCISLPWRQSRIASLVVPSSLLSWLKLNLLRSFVASTAVIG